jgi:pyruvate ferredoxin oxidoreductase alpha subunit
MSETLVTGSLVLTANDAAARAAILARARAIGCYPITPQTLIVERLAELAARRDDMAFVGLESEHSMFGFAIAAARVGVRAFTATSSQGLLYAHEQLHRASRERIPLVIVNVNRAVLAPWSIEPDLADSMSQRDTGWIQLYCSSAQEVLDSVLCAYRIAEEVMLPVMVCAEGFLLSHTSELVDVPEQAAVDAFLPEFSPPEDWILDPTRPRVFSGLPQPAEYFTFQRNVAEAMCAAGVLLGDVAAAFARQFGRSKIASIELTGNAAATTALVTVGSIGESAQELLEADDDLLLARVHAYRPFPAAELGAALAHVSHVCVVDRAPGFGSYGPLGLDVRSLRLAKAEVSNFICGLGGADVTPSSLRWMLDEARAGSPAGPAPLWVPEGV